MVKGVLPRDISKIYEFIFNTFQEKYFDIPLEWIFISPDLEKEIDFKDNKFWVNTYIDTSLEEERTFICLSSFKDEEGISDISYDDAFIDVLKSFELLNHKIIKIYDMFEHVPESSLIFYKQFCEYFISKRKKS